MKIAILLGALLLLTAAAPPVSAAIIQGHSPEVLLLTDPGGYQYGCTAVPTALPCSSTSVNHKGASVWTDSIFNNPWTNSFGNECSPVPGSGSTCAYQTTLEPDGTYFTNITIPNPEPGTWTLTYYSYAKGSFAIAALNCPENNNDASNPNQGHFEPGCKGASLCSGGQYAYLNLCDPDDSGTFFIQSGSFTNANQCKNGCTIIFTVATDGAISFTASSGSTAPEFPLGTAALMLVALPALLFLRKRQLRASS